MRFGEPLAHAPNTLMPDCYCLLLFANLVFGPPFLCRLDKKRVMPPMRNSMQVSLADGEMPGSGASSMAVAGAGGGLEPKLFVGMLPFTATEMVWRVSACGAAEEGKLTRGGG